MSNFFVAEIIMSVLELALAMKCSHVPRGRCPEGCQRSLGRSHHEVHHSDCSFVADGGCQLLTVGARGDVPK